MAIATRSRDGRASSRHSDGELYGLVRRVAVWVNRRRPTKITQAEFDAARSGAGLPDLPSARAICMRLGEAGRSRPWAEVLEIACSERTRPEISHGHRQGGGEAPHLDQRHLHFALNLVAQHLGVSSLTPGDYERGRGELIERESRRRSGRHSHQPDLLEELLPNAAQIERIIRSDDATLAIAAPASAASNGSANGSAGGGGACENDGTNGDTTGDSGEQVAAEIAWGGRGVATGGADWDRALSAAGLEPRAILDEERHRASRGIRGLPLVEAIHHFVEANGRWPSRSALIRFAELADIGVEGQAQGKPWPDYIDEARAFRADRGLASPERLPREVRADPASIRVPSDRIPGAPRRRKTGSGQHTREELLDALERFDRELPAGASRTRAAYARFAKENRLPAPVTLDRRGDGFTAMIAEMRERRSL